jgi:hypothetical protein
MIEQLHARATLPKVIIGDNRIQIRIYEGRKNPYPCLESNPISLIVYPTVLLLRRLSHCCSFTGMVGLRSARQVVGGL